ncbi:MAG: hypothetical protein LBS89_03050 [Zoogloeaceae bacterium]|nr:hypothetical protein [Zoogloeaceae bacterium]
MGAKWVTYSIAALYFLFGIVLYRIVPAFNDVYAGIFSHWTPESSPLIAPFFWPVYLWPLAFGIPALLLALSVRFPVERRKILNYIALPLFFLLALHGMDWLYGFSFCHEWGCSPRLLPTWKLFLSLSFPPVCG